ncbi:non-ribosomal peptide synthetase [Serratia marcescens]|uniref:non-ribosomal peptide synthetase n=1 Tax=Serratia marcescens TaxID=615 RepID=UPI000E05D23D|nr:non-ribosomal peptide synthetase [Serratia marcescens]SUJ17912.1 Dimodular nonribosomal peptide synthase [Serratia marcescens]
MSVIGLINLMEMAKQGAKFGELSPRRQTIEHVDAAALSAVQEDITTFLSVCTPDNSERHTGEKPCYTVNHYAGQYLWLYENFTKNSPLYNIPIAKEILGPFEPERLLAALKKLLKRHGALCGRYRLDGEAITVDIVHPDETIFEHSLEDISRLNSEEQQENMLVALNAQCTIPFDLAAEYPLRCRILRKSAQHHYLFLTFHHCVVDGWTANLLVDELSRDYQAYEEHWHYDNGQAFFRYLEDPFLAVANVDDSMAFWRDELDGAPEKHALEYDIAITAAGKTQNIVRTSLTNELEPALAQLAKHNGTTLFTLLHSAFALLIARESATDRVVIGSPIANRNEPTLNDAVGSFVNTIAHQFIITGDDSFTALLQKNANKFARAFKHQGLPFSYLVEQLKPTRGKFHPIFQIMFVCQHRKSNELNLGGAQVNTLPRSYAPPKFDLVLEVISGAEGIQLEWQYNAKLFTPERINGLAQAYALLLQQIACDPSRAVDHYSLAPMADNRQLRQLSVGQAMPACLRQPLSDRLLRAAHQHGDRPALFEGDQVWHYDRLLRHAGLVAHWLNAHTAPGALIAIDLPRGAHQAIAALGVILAGRAYLPLAEGLPDARVAAIMRISGCAWVVSNRAHHRARYPQTTRVQDLEALFSPPVTGAATFPPGEAEALAYVIYTSGTTGTPKGVAMEHGAVTNTLLTMNQLFNVSHRDNVLALADLAFDLSVYDLFGSWLAGASVTVLSPHDAKEPSAWLHAIRQRKISIWNSVPAILQMLVQYCAQENILSLPQLRHIWLSGDRISPRLIAEAHRLCPNATITSLGGATEGAIWSIYHPLTRDTHYRNAIPYGTALPNQSMWVLNEKLEPCGFGVTGDIYIGGVGVAREYWRDRQTTAGSFVLLPTTGERVYRTGDRGRWHRSGYIEFLGREDQQVKLQGFRVELGDVEFALKSSELVAEACVVCRDETRNGTPYLEAYFTLTEAGKASVQAEQRIREQVTAALPAYMAPSHYHLIERFPLSRNGKLDRTLLSPGTERSQASDVVPAASAELMLLRELLADTLGCAPDKIDPYASFFSNGGSSLSGITFLGNIKRALNVELTLAEILGYSQLDKLAERLRDNAPLPLSMLSGAADRPSLPTLYLVHGAGGQVHQYAKWTKQLSACANIITIASPGLAAPGADDTLTLQRLAASHLAAIPRAKRDTAVIAGWSLGGQLAVHMAAQATEQGAPFAHAVLVDSGLPAQQPSVNRGFSVAQSYLSLFDSLGIARHLCRHQETNAIDSFANEIKMHYALNQSVLAEKITLEHAEAFCWALKKSFDLTNNAGPLPQIAIPLTLWLSQQRQRKHPNLAQRWEKQSSHDVQLNYCAETHYSILNNAQLLQALTRMLRALSTSLE